MGNFLRKKVFVVVSVFLLPRIHIRNNPFSSAIFGSTGQSRRDVAKQQQQGKNVGENIRNVCYSWHESDTTKKGSKSPREQRMIKIRQIIVYTHLDAKLLQSVRTGR